MVDHARVDLADVTVDVAAASHEDHGELSRLTHRLSAELRTLEVTVLTLESVLPPPDGSKAASGPVAALGIKLGTATLNIVMSKIRDWVGRNKRGVRVTIDGDTVLVTHPTASQQEKLINAWLARHADGS